jgi:heat shock protein HslJ
MRYFILLRSAFLLFLGVGMASIPVVATLTLGTPTSVSAASAGGVPEVVPVNGSWVVQSPRSLAQLQTRTPTLIIEGNGRYRSYSGNDSCNTYFGRVRLLAHRVHFLPAMSTKKACQDEAMSDALYHNLLSKSRSIVREGQLLKLYSGDRELLLTFKPAVVSVP